MQSVKRSLAVSLCIATVALIPLSAMGQTYSTVGQAKPGEPEHVAVIRLFSQIDQNTVGLLLAQVDGQLRQGTKKFVILISSGGGDVLSGFTAYNYLKGIPAEVTTFNVGNVDSAATVIYCAGKNRYSVPDARFLFHGVSLTLSGNLTLDSSSLEAQLGQLKNQNQMIERVVASTINKPDKETEQLVSTQTILTPEQAKKMGLVHEIKTDLFQSGAQLAQIGPTPELPTPVISTLPIQMPLLTPSTPLVVGIPVVKFEPVPGIISNLPPEAWRLSTAVNVQ
jgi:ATP-dependent Clp protease protease subunit